jgi:hypothetical protein
MPAHGNAHPRAAATASTLPIPRHQERQAVRYASNTKNTVALVILYMMIFSIKPSGFWPSCPKTLVIYREHILHALSICIMLLFYMSD